jgi:hypothetical protein
MRIPAANECAIYVISDNGELHSLYTLPNMFMVIT